MNELVGLSYSPWSEKARWALDHHKVPYRKTEYLPMLGEPLLRLRTRRFSGRVTVPILFAGDAMLGDSYDIARWAEAHGTGTPLFPTDRPGDVLAWNDRSERGLAAARALGLHRLHADKEAQRESVPTVVPAALRGPGATLTVTVIDFFAKKYGFQGADLTRHHAELRDVLGELDTALGGKDYLLGTFSYADVVMAVTLQLVSPVADAYIRMGPATRACCTISDLVTEYPRLFAWRDRLYAKHRAN
jgi:glutathione S-transferase